MTYSLFWTIAYNSYQQNDESGCSWPACCLIACVSFCAGMLIDWLLRSLFKTDNSVISDTPDKPIPPNPFAIFDDKYEKPRKSSIPIPPSPFIINSPFDQPAEDNKPIIPAQSYNRLVDQILSICDEYKAKLKRHHNLVKLCEKNLINPQTLSASQNKPLRRNRPYLVHVDRVDVDKYDALIPLHNSYSRKYAKLCETIRCNENKLRERGLIV